MLYRKVPKHIVGILLSYAFLSNGCQQTGLNIGEEDIVQSKPAAKVKQDTQASAIVKSPGAELVVTSASDTSPEDKQVEVASSKAVAKRPPTEQPGEEASITGPKRAKKEEELPGHRAWFTAFTQAVARVEESSSDEEAWDLWEDVLFEGRTNNFLIQSILYPKDDNPDIDWEYTPLHYVAAKGILSLVKELVLCEEVLVDIKTQNNKSTPLHFASSRGHLDVVQFLIEKGADPNLMDAETGNALHYAAAGRRGAMNRDVIEYLETRGADIKKTTDTGTTMVGVAVLTSNLPIIEYWKDNYINSQDPDIDKLTKKALALAKYRLKHFPQEKSIQSQIVKILNNFLETRQDRSKAANASE